MQAEIEQVGRQSGAVRRFYYTPPASVLLEGPSTSGNFSSADARVAVGVAAALAWLAQLVDGDAQQRTQR